MSGLVEGPGGWLLAPEGAAVYPAERTAVVADVHLGYESARGGSGDCVPAHSLAETLERLTTLFDRVRVERLVVAGDLVESRRPCVRTARDVAGLGRWLAGRGVALLSLAGNHDPPRRPALPETVEIGGWTVGHGHRPIVAARTVSGHHHPALRAPGLSAPCFLISEEAIVLPAFSPNAAGASLAVLDPALTRDRPGGAPRCVASAGGTLLDFGPVPDLLRALQGTLARESP